MHRHNLFYHFTTLTNHINTSHRQPAMMDNTTAADEGAPMNTATDIFYSQTEKENLLCIKDEFDK